MALSVFQGKLAVEDIRVKKWSKIMIFWDFLEKNFFLSFIFLNLTFLGVILGGEHDGAIRFSRKNSSRGHPRQKIVKNRDFFGFSFIFFNLTFLVVIPGGKKTLWLKNCQKLYIRPIIIIGMFLSIAC